MIFYHKLDSLTGFKVKAKTTEIVKINGTSALKLNGMIVFPRQNLKDASIEVEMLAKDSCYPGIIFRMRNEKNYELAYAVPHASKQPDALQYDPVFNGSNTWQLFNGEFYQKAALVPTGTWFKLRIDVIADQAAIRLGDQPPLIINHLAHPQKQGQIGLWTFKPAFFRNLRISLPPKTDHPQGASAKAPMGAILDWKLQGGNVLKCEPNGILNLNRYLQLSKKPAKISRRFYLSHSSSVEIGVGFSDLLLLYVDGKEIFSGYNLFKGFKDIPSRGWVVPDQKKLKLPLKSGNHEIAAELKVTEPFGWGLVITLNGKGVQLESLKGTKEIK